MTTQTIAFDNEMKALSQGVYKGNEKSLPKDWIELSKFENLNSGFYAKAFYKNGTVVISIRGTDFEETNDLENDKEIAKMSQEEYKRLENFIENQIAKGFVLPQEKANEEVKIGNLIWVNAYTRSDGTEVSGYYRHK